jgi:hypothetical protein
MDESTLYFLLILVAVILSILIDYFIAKEFYIAAQAKGFYEKKYFWICFILTAVGYLLVIALPNRVDAQKEANNDLPVL